MPSRGGDWPYPAPGILSKNASWDSGLSEAMAYDAGKSCRLRSSDYRPCLNEFYAESRADGPDWKLSWTSRTKKYEGSPYTDGYYRKHLKAF